MKQIEVSNDALERISRLRDGSEEYGMIVGNIALSQARLAQLIILGRDEDNIKPWTEDLQDVMHTLSEYTDLVTALYDTSYKEPDTDTTIEKRLICSFKLWHCMTDLEEVIKVLQRIESYCKDEDKEELNGVISLINEFDKDIKKPVNQQ